MTGPIGIRSILQGFTAGAECLARKGDVAGVAGFFLSSVHCETEFVYRRDLSLDLCSALSQGPGRELLTWARRTPQAHLLQRKGMEGRVPALYEAMTREALDALALFPILGERSVLGYFLLGIPLDGRGTLGNVEGAAREWQTVNQWLEGLRREAGMTVLRRLLGFSREGLAQNVQSLLVLDSEDRILFSHRMSRVLSPWGRGEVIGRSLKSLPGGRVLAGLDPAGSGHLDWRTRKVPLGDQSLSLSLAALPLDVVKEGWAPWRAVLVQSPKSDQGAHAGGVLLELALRLAPATAEESADDLQNQAWALVEQALAAAEQAQSEEAINLSGLFRGFLHRLEPELQDDRIRVLPVLQDELPYVRGDRRLLETALWAILQKSWSSLLPRGGTITLRTWEEEGSVWCTISDDGEGVQEASMLEMLALEPLLGSRMGIRLPNSGLEMARELVRLGGGTFHVETRTRLWTRYSVVFPAERVVQQPWAQEEPGVPPAVEVRRKPNGQMAVLVVDDNQMVRTVLRKYLEKKGHEVMEAVDGGAALEILQGRAFDRVMVDIDMPGTTGVEFYKRLDAVNPTMRDRTVFMTGGFQEPETEDFIQGTGRPHIHKPFDLSEISDVLTT